VSFYQHPGEILTEKLLYFSGAIREAGTVKGKKTGKFATSDWMKVIRVRYYGKRLS
jgi:peptide subunit release factor RF-3